MIKTIPASKFCHRVFDGTHATPKPASEGRPLVTSKNIVGGRLDLKDVYNISQADYEEIQRRSYVSQWDVLFSMIGSVGEVYLESNPRIEYAVKNVGVFSCLDEQRAKWLYYFLKSPIAKRIIKNQMSGAVQKFLGLGALRDFPIPEVVTNRLPSIELLSTLDAKIELNNRINAELEGMAKLLYDYWFVQFDFPINASQAATMGNPSLEGKPYRASGGQMIYNEILKREIPVGWKDSTIGETFNTHLGGTPAKQNAQYWNPSEVNWLSSGENPSTFVVAPDEKISELGLRNSAAKLLPAGAVVLSIVRHLRASILGIDAATNQSVVGILETDKFKHCFIYPYILREIPRLMVLRTGAQQPHINKGILDESPLVIPDKLTLEAYTKLTVPLFSEIKNHQQQNQELTALRDWLLPLLLNGKVTVTSEDQS